MRAKISLIAFFFAAGVVSAVLALLLHTPRLTFWQVGAMVCPAFLAGCIRESQKEKGRKTNENDTPT